MVSLDALAASVDFGRVGHAAARFSEEELAQLNARTLHLLPYGLVSSRLAERDADLGEAFWVAARGNLARLDEAQIWATVVRGPIAPVIEDADFLAEAAGKLPSEPWDETTWKSWTSGLGRKERALLHPLRLALTGQERGPEMARLLPLIGRGRATDRLHGRKA